VPAHPTPPLPSLDVFVGGRFAATALSHLSREYPNKLDHVLNGPDDVRAPRALHPIFFGSFDWHSCVHGYWMLAHLYRRFPSLDEGPRIRAQFDQYVTPAGVAAEVAYLQQPSRGGFERPYGWAWLLMLGGELARHDTAEGRRWSGTLQPLVDAFVQRVRAYLPKATYPVRVGTHFNTAFALTLALAYAQTVNDESFADLLREKANAWYGDDADCQAWEPGGDDFLSSALIEAECMRRVMPPAGFDGWLRRFLPRIEQRLPATLFRPAHVSDRRDGKIAHLDGLNLTRAWCWRSIAQALPPADPRVAVARQTAGLHLAASLPHVTGDYMGEHWLASFGALALGAAEGA
jgi:Protein of unknown function (DUF2891)